jgi:virginiamycin B lyase
MACSAKIWIFPLLLGSLVPGYSIAQTRIVAPMRRTLSSLPITVKMAVPGGPDWLAAGYNSIWVSNGPRNSVSRIDPVKNKVIATIPVGRDPCLGIGIAFAEVWIPNCKDRALSEIDPRTNTLVRTLRVNIAGEGEGAIAVGEGSLWLLTNENGTNSGTLSRIDPVSGHIAKNIKVADKSYVAVFGFGSVWVTGTGSGVVFRVDPRRNRVVAKIWVGGQPRFAAVGERAIWVMNQADGSVSRIDPRKNRVAATIAVGVPGPGGDIATGNGFVWVSADGTPLSQIDPSTNSLVRQFRGGSGADALRVAYNSVWISDHKRGQVWRIPLPALLKMH